MLFAPLSPNWVNLGEQVGPTLARTHPQHFWRFPPRLMLPQEISHNFKFPHTLLTRSFVGKRYSARRKSDRKHWHCSRGKWAFAQGLSVITSAEMTNAGTFSFWILSRPKGVPPPESEQWSWQHQFVARVERCPMCPELVCYSKGRSFTVARFELCFHIVWVPGECAL